MGTRLGPVDAAGWAPLACALLCGVWLLLAVAALLLATGDSSTGVYSKPADGQSQGAGQPASSPGRGPLASPSPSAAGGLASAAAFGGSAAAFGSALLAGVRGLVQQLDAGACVCLPRVSKHWFWVFYALGTPLAAGALVATLAAADGGAPAAGPGGDATPAASARLRLAQAAAVPFMLLVHCARRLAEHVASGDVGSSLRPCWRSAPAAGPASALATAGSRPTAAAGGESAPAAGRPADGRGPATLSVTAPAPPSMGPVTYIGGLAHYVLAAASALAAGTAARLPSGTPSPAAEQWAGAAWAALAAAAIGLEAAQWMCHSQLRALRPSNQASAQRGRVYVLPHGGAFELCLSPHYAAEAASYWCWAALAALAGRDGPPAAGWVWAAAALWVSVNLSISGARTRKWYAQKFGEARLEGRGAILPACSRPRPHVC